MSTENIFNENEGSRLIRGEIDLKITEAICGWYPRYYDEGLLNQYVTGIYWVLLIFESYNYGNWISKVDISLRNVSQRHLGFIYTKDWKSIENISYITSLICEILQKPITDNYDYIEKNIRYSLWKLHWINKKKPELEIKKERKKREKIYKWFSPIELIAFYQIQRICKIPEELIEAFDITREAEREQRYILEASDRIRKRKDWYFKKYWKWQDKALIYLKEFYGG